MLTIHKLSHFLKNHAFKSISWRVCRNHLFKLVHEPIFINQLVVALFKRVNLRWFEAIKWRTHHHIFCHIIKLRYIINNFIASFCKNVGWSGEYCSFYGMFNRFFLRSPFFDTDSTKASIVASKGIISTDGGRETRWKLSISLKLLQLLHPISLLCSMKSHQFLSLRTLFDHFNLLILRSIFFFFCF